MNNKNTPASANAKANKPLPMPTEDSLLNALHIVKDHYKIGNSVESMVSGLAFKNGKLTTQQFIRAVKRGGLNAKVMDRKAEKISAYTLPAVVYWQDGTFGLVVGIKETAEGTTEYNVLNTSNGQHGAIDMETFKAAYGGFIILMKPFSEFQAMAAEMEQGGKWFWTVIKQFKKLYVQVGLAALFINLFALISPLFVMNVYDRVVPNAAFETLWVLAIGITAGYTFEFVFKQLRAYFIDTAGKGADILLASKIYEHVLNVRLGSRKTSSGAFANQLREFETLRDFFTSSTMVTLIDLPFLFIFIAVIGMIGGWLFVIPLLAVPIVILVSYFVQLPLQAVIEKAQEEQDNKHGHLVETIYGLETIKALGTQSRAQGRWEQLVGETARSGSRGRFLTQLALNFSQYAGQLVSVGTIIMGVYLITAGSMTMGGLIACSILVGRTMAPLSQAVSLYVRFQQSAVSMKNLSQIMALPVERTDGQGFLHLEKLKGNVEFKDIEFSYPKAKMQAIQNVSFSIKAGEKVGLIGRAGSGKSTLTRLLASLYQPNSGQILIDGLEMRQIDPVELRRSMSYVPQNTMLFKGTLRENLLLANPEATDADMVAAAEGASVMDFVRRHPMGFDMPIGESGEGLSTGQRQAVGIARALLRDAPLVILDDPTSEMDNRTETHILDALKKWQTDKTVILITHRAPMLELVDRLIVMDYAKIMADGPKDTVLTALRGGKIQGTKK